MAFLSSINIVGSGMTAQQLRLDVISENITNIGTTRTEAGGAYRRKMVVLQSESGRDGFRAAMAAASGRGITSGGSNPAPGGVRVAEIAQDPSELPLVYDPSHPDANADGYVEMPNVTLVKELTDAMAATQAFSANVTAFNALKEVIARGLEIGR